MRAALGRALVLLIAAGCSGGDPLYTNVITIDPLDMTTGFEGTLAVRSRTSAVPEDDIELVTWPDLLPIAIARETTSTDAEATVELTPEVALTPGWYAVRVESPEIAWTSDLFGTGPGMVLSRFGVDQDPQLAIAREIGGQVVVRFSESLADATEWVDGVRASHDGAACVRTTQEGPAREIVFDCAGAAEIDLVVAAGVRTVRGPTVVPFTGTITVRPDVHRFDPM